MAQMQLGQVVISRAGRDKGRFMIVVGIIDSDFVYVADGSLRKIENPKKKNVKHLKIINKSVDIITKKLKTKRKITNEQIKEALQELLDEEK